MHHCYEVSLPLKVRVPQVDTTPLQVYPPTFVSPESVATPQALDLARFEGVLDASHVESKIVFNEDKPEKTSGSVVVALVGFSSRNTARDRHAQRSLETGVFPSARLELRGLQRVVLHKAAEEHETRFKGACRADLYLHGQRSDWPVEVELQWSKDELVVLSSFTILLDNFSIRRDKLLGMPIRNEVPVSVELRYRRRR